MTVSELIESLKDCDPDSEVVLSSDAEGNNFETLEDVGGPSFFQDGAIDDDGPGIPCVVLWPA